MRDIWIILDILCLGAKIHQNDAVMHQGVVGRHSVGWEIIIYAAQKTTPPRDSVRNLAFFLPSRSSSIIARVYFFGDSICVLS